MNLFFPSLWIINISKLLYYRFSRNKGLEKIFIYRPFQCSLNATGAIFSVVKGEHVASI